MAADGARLSAAGPAGLRYAVETLAQLVDARGFLPACSIEDAPDFPRRGIMLDVSRGKVPTLATLHALVDLCVRLKLNVLMLYVEHTFRFRRHPEIGAGASPLDAASLRELDAYAAGCFVDLIPSLQSLGHMERILALPRYAPLAETDAALDALPGRARELPAAAPTSTTSSSGTSVRAGSTPTATSPSISSRGNRASAPRRSGRAGSISSMSNGCGASRSSTASRR